MHPSAARGFAREAAAYARGRPDYPPEIEGWLTATLGLAPGRRVLDLGAGTGKFTARLAATGAAVAAVEPVAEMRARCAAAAPAAEVREGAAEAIPFPGGGFDAVVCAQAFHWFSTPAALAEIRRVLAPGGRLGLVWNVRDESRDWVAQLTEIMRPFEGDAPRYASGAWRRLFPAPGFGPLAETRFPTPIPARRNAWWWTACSQSVSSPPCRPRITPRSPPRCAPSSPPTRTSKARRKSPSPTSPPPSAARGSIKIKTLRGDISALETPTGRFHRLRRTATIPSRTP